jgi:hypothetical protein
VTEDHAAFTINPATAQLIPIKGGDVKIGMPLVVPFDLSACASAWVEDIVFLDLTNVFDHSEGRSERQHVMSVDGCLTNRLKITQISSRFPATDDFLYIVDLWLAEGGEHEASTEAVQRLRWPSLLEERQEQ